MFGLSGESYERRGQRGVMETILVLVYAEADGSLAKPAREALGAAKS